MSRFVKAGMLALAVGTGAVALTGSVGLAHVTSCHKPKKAKSCKFKAYPTIQDTNQDPVPVPPGGGPPPPPTADPIDFFSGGLTAKPAGSACVPSRTVRVVRVSDGVVIGEATTFNDGTWQLPMEDVAAGQYQAKTVKKNVTLTIPPVPGVSSGHKHGFICIGAHSGQPPITAGP